MLYSLLFVYVVINYFLPCRSALRATLNLSQIPCTHTHMANNADSDSKDLCVPGYHHAISAGWSVHPSHHFPFLTSTVCVGRGCNLIAQCKTKYWRKNALTF